MSVAGLALVLIGLILALVDFAERNRGADPAQDHITETLTEVLDNEHTRRS